MSILQQPILFASEPASGLVGLGLLLTVTAIIVVVSLVVAFALSAEEPKPENVCKGKAKQPRQHPGCGEAALS